jgi:SAM-dependent methyltransferase
MLSYFGRTTHIRIFYFLVLLAILYVAVIMRKTYLKREGFSETVEEKYVIKRNENIYDDYYANVYDKIYEPKKAAKEIADFVISFTQASTSKSVMLDCGSGTGELMAYIKERGFNIFGIDRSEDMVEYATSKYPDLRIKTGDVTIPMTYDKSTFSHILCIGLQNPLYNTRDKQTLFSNFYHWLIPNGYLVIQLADKKKFDPIPPAGRSSVLENPQTIAEDRITQTEIKFVDFQYKSNYEFGREDGAVLVTETFTDSGRRNVRQNEQILYMDDIDSIIDVARKCGFLVHGQMNLLSSIGDEHQYVFLLEKPH